MATRLVKWNLDGTVLNIKQANVEEGTVEVQENFELTELFPMYGEFNDVQQQIVAYGTKQKLSDTGSAEKSFMGKISAAVRIWKQLLRGEWTGERVNKSEKAEKRRNTKAAAELGFSLVELLTKKVTEGLTEEEEQKLASLLAVQEELKSKLNK